MSLEEQLDALQALVPQWALKTDPNVRGDFTSGDYIEWQLSRIFGPQHWSLQITSGPDLVTISDTKAYSRATVRLTVTFSGGHYSTQDAAGVWPVTATNATQGGTLENTAPHIYETALKAAVTDALKAAAERLGTCFRPIRCKALKRHLARRDFQQSEPVQQVTNASVDEQISQLFAPPNKQPQVQGQPLPTAQPRTQKEYWDLAAKAFAAGVPNDTIRSIANQVANGDGWQVAYDTLQAQIPA